MNAKLIRWLRFSVCGFLAGVVASSPAAEISNFDASEGLDLGGEVLYAVNIGANFGDEELDFGGVTFTSDQETDGFDMFSTHEIRDNWAAPDLGDDELDLIVSTIRWSASPEAVEMEMDVTQGQSYKLQMLFYEACCNRGFDVLVDDEVIVEDFAIHENHVDWDGFGNWGIQAGRQDGVLITEEVIATSNILSVWLGGDRTAPDYPDNNGHISALILSAGGTSLQPGDANMDLRFDQIDLVQVQVAAKYLSGQDATWGEGDWNGGPGGAPGDPPVGDNRFDQLDIISALTSGVYLTGPYAAVPDVPNGDGNATLVYNPGTGELAVEVGAAELTSINIDSEAAIFTGEPAMNLGGSFDNDSDNNIFKATFGSSFGSLSFGNVAQTGLSKDFVLGDLSVIGSLAGGGDLGVVDLRYVPEPSTFLLAGIALLGLIGLARRK